MVYLWVAFHKDDGNHENEEKTKTTQTATNKELSSGFVEITKAAGMTKTTGIRGANHRFNKQRV